MSVALSCEPCGKNFTGFVSYQQHLESVKHQRKISSLSILNGVHNLELQYASRISSSRQLNTVFKCSLCDLIFDSVRNFEIHSISVEHAQKVMGKKLENVASDVTSSLDPEGGNSYDKNIAVYPEGGNGCHKNITVDHEGNGYDKNIAVDCVDSSSNKNLSVDESDKIIPVTDMFKSQILSFSSCATCKKCFSGPEPYMQHMESASHKKKVEFEKYVLSDKTNQNGLEFSCEPCNKIFSGQIPYIQHMQSEIHKKKLLNAQYLEKFDSVAGSNVKEESHLWRNPDVFLCKVCSVFCSGLVSYKQHLEGTPHLKKIRAQIAISSVPQETSIQLGLTQCNNIEGKLQQEFGSEKSNLQIANHNLQSTEDHVIPNLIDKMENMCSENLEESVTIFLPDEPIDFDRSDNKISSKAADESPPDVSKQTEANEKSGTKQDCEENGGEFHRCDTCDVRLLNKEEIINHYESMEHIRKKGKNLR